jgi:ATP-dependent RNA helicase RhlE
MARIARPRSMIKLLPYNPQMTESMTPPLLFSALALDPLILRAIEATGYTTPTPIQAQAIPKVLAGRDLMAMAQTGTGKTAAFTLPLLQRLLPHASSSMSPARHPIRALILAPTRELAIQVEASVVTYAKHTKLRSTVVYGGTDIRAQKPLLANGIEILVATPGRLLDHVESKNLLLNQVQVLILDEADRMLDMGFMPDLKRILALLPKQRQTLLFSATFSDEIKKLAQDFLRDPVTVETQRIHSNAETVKQSICKVAHDDKFAALLSLIRGRGVKQVLVFTRTKLSAAKVARMLDKEGIPADAIHGDKTQLERMQALDAFKSGKVLALVATDVAARGLDIDQLPLVINYELPTHAEDYVHRIGRTGRAGAFGEAVSLVDDDEARRLSEIENLLQRVLPQETLTLAKPPRPAAPAPQHYVKPHPPKSHTGKDDWFTKPYQPSAPVQKMDAQPVATIDKPKPRIAALLGGSSIKR